MITKTGYVYDPIFLKHHQSDHPENAFRLKAIMEELTSSGLIEIMIKIPSRHAADEELQLVHSKKYIESVKAISQRGGGYFDIDTYTTPDSYNAASIAAGGIIDLGLAIAQGELKNGYALLRPPGHHSLPDQAIGFCIFSNAAITTKAIQLSTTLSKIAIVDFDVHHGNGTQDVFYADPNVLFISSHQYPHYPGSGSVNETGVGSGEGFTINFPLRAFCGDKSIKILYEEILKPIMKDFHPEMIIVSAGYDCHWNDPLANLGFSLSGIAWISEYLVKLADELCGGKILFTLEGGYNLEALKIGTANSIRALLGENNYQDPLGQSPAEEPPIEDLLARLKSTHHIL